MIRRFITLAAGLATAGALALGAAGTASAAVHAPGGSFTAVTARTVLHNRPDSGGAGNDWATFPELDRTLTVTFVSSAPAADCGGAAGCMEFTASLADTGSWVTIAGQLAPNQGPGHAGQVIKRAIVGDLTHGAGGFGPFFSASVPSAALVPASVSGSTDPSSMWPALAFPGPVFGLSESTFDYEYSPLPSARVPGQGWSDSTAGDGQLPVDGQITG